MKSRNAFLDQLLGLLDRPLYSNLFYSGVVPALIHFVGKVFGNVYMKRCGKDAALRLGRDGLQPRNDGNVNSRLTTMVDKFKILLVVEEHLCYDIFGAEFHF